MERVIIESPFAGNCNLNVNYARLAVRHSLSLGESPIASHLLYTQKGILNDDKEDERMWGINAGLEWKKVADKQIFYIDLGWSRGMIYAKEYCVLNDIKTEERYIFETEKELSEFFNKYKNDNSLIVFLENK